MLFDMRHHFRSGIFRQCQRMIVAFDKQLLRQRFNVFKIHDHAVFRMTGRMQRFSAYRYFKSERMPVNMPAGAVVAG